jgi:hypothetical protein
MTIKTACPDEEKLGDYLEGRLSENESAALEAHLADCELCLEAFTIGGKVIQDPPADLEEVPIVVTNGAVRLVYTRSSPWTRVVESEVLHSVKEAISWLFPFHHFWNWKPAAIRGSDKGVAQDLVTVQRVFKGLPAQIELEKTGEEKAQIRVRVEERSGERIRVTLKKGEREVSSFILEGGYGLFEEIPFGQYELVFSLNGDVLGTYSFEIKESRHG